MWLRLPICRTHSPAKMNVLYIQRLASKLGTLYPGQYIVEFPKDANDLGMKIWPAMEITCVKTLPYNHMNIASYITLTFGSLTYRLFLNCRTKLLRSRLREAGPIASYCVEQCVHAYQSCSISSLSYIKSQVLHRKTDWLFECNCFWYWCMLQHTVRLTRPI